MLLSEFSSFFIRNKIYFCKTSINLLSQNRGTESPEGTEKGTSTEGIFATFTTLLGG